MLMDELGTYETTLAAVVCSSRKPILEQRVLRMGGALTDEPTSSTKVGNECYIIGLASRPELNGTYGQVVAWNGQRGRYAVELPSGENIMLKPLRIVPLAPAAPRR